jgi:hypothetical protein
MTAKDLLSADADASTAIKILTGSMTAKSA